MLFISLKDLPKITISGTRLYLTIRIKSSLPPVLQHHVALLSFLCKNQVNLAAVLFLQYRMAKASHLTV